MAEISDAHFRAVVASVFGVEPSRILDTLRPGDLPSWDSLGHLSLISALEQAFAIGFTMEESLSINSVADVKAVLHKHGIHLSNSRAAS